MHSITGHMILPDDICTVLQTNCIIGCYGTSFIFQVLIALCMTVTQIACYRAWSREVLGRQKRSPVPFSSIPLPDSDHSKRTVFDNISNGRARMPQPFSADNNLPWECGTNVTWRDLGDLYFPRYISETVCPESTCWYGHFACRPVIHTIKVLKMRENTRQERTLPQALRRQWVLADVQTSSFCQCGR